MMDAGFMNLNLLLAIIKVAMGCLNLPAEAGGLKC
jgi:hypothetical protein